MSHYFFPSLHIQCKQKLEKTPAAWRPGESERGLQPILLSQTKCGGSTCSVGAGVEMMVLVIGATLGQVLCG